MSKLFKLKEWLTVPDAASYLSHVLNEEVTETDLLQFAAEKKLSLSIYFSNAVFARELSKIQFSWLDKNLISTDFEELFKDLDKQQKDEKFFLFWVERDSIDSLFCATVLYRKNKKQISEISGICDFLSCGEVDIEREFRSKKFHIKAICQNELHYVVETTSKFTGENEVFELVTQTIAGGYNSIRELPANSFFVIRTNKLREFEQKIAEDSNLIDILPESTDDLGTRETQHEMILAVIAALDFEPLQIPDKGKAKIKKFCLTRPRVFTDSGFEHAWKAGLKAGYFKLENHEKFSPKK